MGGIIKKNSERSKEIFCNQRGNVGAQIIRGICRGACNVIRYQKINPGLSKLKANRYLIRTGKDYRIARASAP